MNTSQNEMLAILESIGFLHDLEQEDLQQLAELCRSVQFPKEATIFHQNDVGDDVYLIVRGKVSLVICTGGTGCRQIAELGDGELLAWSPLLQRKRMSATARALEPTTAVVIDGNQLFALCAQRPSLGYQLMHRTAQVMAERLTSTRLQLLHLGGVHLPQVVLESD